jgi:hypothetical protein
MDEQEILVDEIKKATKYFRILRQCRKRTERRCHIRPSRHGVVLDLKSCRSEILKTIILYTYSHVQKLMISQTC